MHSLSAAPIMLALPTTRPGTRLNDFVQAPASTCPAGQRIFMCNLLRLSGGWVLSSRWEVHRWSATQTES
ncbi:MAG: hypothetical protein ACE5R6_09705 [Candidatus Heimdallarchaeota archaeon]